MDEWDEGCANAARRLRALQQSPQAFGHSVEDVQWIETHISWLLLAGDFVYKFKKPLRLDFLDFSTLALRRSACVEELRINRRTAPELYLGLVGLVDGPGGSLRLLPLDGAPSQAEPAVRMRRFAQNDVLVQVLEHGQLQPEHMDALAQHIAHFHAQAAVAGAGTGWGSAAAVRAQVADVLKGLLTAVGEADQGRGWATQVQRLARWCGQQGAVLDAVFGARKAAGHVREGHGDLHLGNLVLLGGRPQLFDAIEFKPALRWIDCVADIAFLAMDLEARGRSDLAWRFLNAWLELTGDYGGMRVLTYYRVYRALVRALVAGLRKNQATHAGQMVCAQEQQRYLALAERLAAPRPVGLWLTHGFSGSGKSTHSQTLVCQRGMVRLRADVERKRLYGLAADGSSSAVPGGIYGADATERTYARLEDVSRQLLEAGFPVLVDATFLDAAMRQRFIALAQAQGVPCHILCFTAPLAVLQERVLARQRTGNDASEAGVKVLEAQWAVAQPLAASEETLAVHVDTTQAIDWDRLLSAALTNPGDQASGAAAPSS